MKTRRIIFTLAAIAWMTLIFCMSAQNGTESSGLSDQICAFFGHVFVKGYDSWDAVRQAAFRESISFFVRKAAHMTEYAILGILWLQALRSYGIRLRRSVLFSFLISAGYAATDEAHQVLVAGRAGQIRDVAIDAAGAAVGIAVAGIIIMIRFEKREKADDGQIPS